MAIDYLRACAADALRPLERLSPNAWAEKNRVLPEGKSPRPGPWRSEPWQREILDAFNDRDHRGIIVMKSGQTGGSEIAVNLVGYIFQQMPCPVLFLCSTDTLAREFSLDRFGYMIESCPSLRNNFLLGKAHHESIAIKRAVNGKLVIWGGQSENKLMSEPFRVVVIDEFDRLPVFPGTGDAFKLAKIRTSAYNRYARIVGYSTPTEKDRGIAEQFYNESTQERFVVPCPHCEEGHALRWDNVVIPDKVAAAAFYRCPFCGEAWTDRERWAALARGRYVSELTEAEAPSRMYRGFHISQLYIRGKTIADLAADFCSCTSEAQLKVFYNSQMGEPYTSTVEPLSMDDLRNLIGGADIEKVPDDFILITAGADVQKDIHSPTFYVDVSAWDSRGTKHLVWYGKIMGWEALRLFVQEKKFEDTRKKKHPISLMAIDSQFGTMKVYKFCRNRANKSIPIRHQGREFLSKKKLYGGSLTLWVIHEQLWLDRVIGRYQVEPGEAGGVTLPANTSEEYLRHFRKLRQIEKENPDGKTRLLWVKDGKYARVDYPYAAIYSEVAAYLLKLDDRIQEARGKKLDRNTLPAGVRRGMVKKIRRSGKIRV